jgi:hypothetical protein
MASGRFAACFATNGLKVLAAAQITGVFGTDAHVLSAGTTLPHLSQCGNT